MIVADSIQFWIIFAATCAVVIIKLAMVIYLSMKIHKRKKEASLAVPFMRGFMILILFLLLSRISYMFFDFYFTKFDISLYPYPPQVWFWKVGQILGSIGLAAIVFVSDRQLLGFKFKGIFAYIVLAGGVFVLVYPVNNLADFDFLETMSIIPSLSLLVLFFCLLNIAIKTTGTVRRNATILIVATVCYALSAVIVNAGLINALTAALGFDMDIYIYLLQVILKIVGISLMAYGASRWI